MDYQLGDKIWYYGYNKWFRAFVVDHKHDRYLIDVITGDGRVVQAVGVNENLLRPLTCPILPKVEYYELVEKNWPYSDAGDYSKSSGLH